MKIMQLMDNLERQFKRLGLVVTRSGRESLLVQNGANALSVSYELFDMPSPKGGVDGRQSPFLGIMGAHPGSIVLSSSSHVSGDISDVLDSVVGAQMLVIMATLANNIIVKNDAAFSCVLFPNCDHHNLGV